MNKQYISKSRKLTFLLGFLIFCLLASCKKDDTSNLVIYVYPENIHITAPLDTIIRFNISCSSDELINNFKITRDIIGFPKINLIDSSISTKLFNLEFDFFVDNDLPASDLILDFYCQDVSGNSSTKFRRIKVTDFEFPLVETSGHKMYSRISQKECAYNLYTGQALALSDTSDYQDIIDNSFNYNSLSNTWLSRTNLEFVVFNEFDYANATNRTAKNGFDAGIKVTELIDLEIGDIIITVINRGEIKDYYVVIEITNIVNNVGIDDDYYEFNLKKS